MTAKNLPSDLLGKVKELIKKRRKIEAIKVIREGTGWGLKEAKDAVDALAKEMG